MLTIGVIKKTRSFRAVANRLGKAAAACLVIGAAMLPQLARSASSYTGTALSDNPVAFWPLTETINATAGGVQAVDASGNGHNGLYGTTSQNGFNNILGPQPPTFQGFTNGQGALQTTASDANSPVSVPNLSLNTNAVTITMWINPISSPAASVGLFMNRNG